MMMTVIAILGSILIGGVIMYAAKIMVSVK